MLFIFLGMLLLFFLLVNMEKIAFARAFRLLTRKFKISEDLNQSKDQLFSILSHDLRSPVHTLQIYISKLNALLTGVNSPEALNVARDTERLIATIQSLLDNLLYWSLSQSDRIVYHPETIALKPLIDQVSYDFLPIADSKNIVLKTVAADNVECTGDVNSLKIILRNLLDNAIKYTPVNGSVTVIADQEKGVCRIMVQDNGIGMEENRVHALLNTETRRIQEDIDGRRTTGLGLWLVKTMAEKNGGSISVLSEPGIGTLVTITLPVGPVAS
jgi:signal transduction histidine kinase